MVSGVTLKIFKSKSLVLLSNQKYPLLIGKSASVNNYVKHEKKNPKHIFLKQSTYQNLFVFILCSETRHLKWLRINAN